MDVDFFYFCVLGMVHDSQTSKYHGHFRIQLAIAIVNHQPTYRLFINSQVEVEE